MKTTSILAATVVWAALAGAGGAADGPESDALPCTRVTILNDGITLREAVNVLSQASGATVTDGNSPGGSLGNRPPGRAPNPGAVAGEPVYFFNLDNRPFCEALASVAQQVRQTDVTRTISVAFKSGERIALDGKLSGMSPFLLVGQRIVHDADYRRAEDDVDRLYLEAALVTDPKVRLAYWAGYATATKALDDLGHSLVTRQALPDRTILPPARAYAQPQVLRIVLERPPGPVGRKIVTMEGTVPAALVTRVDVIELTIPEKTSRKYGDLQANFECRLDPSSGAGINVSAEFQRPAAMSDDQWNDWDKRLASTLLRLEDADERQFTSGGGGGSWGPKSRSMSSRFSIGAGGFRPPDAGPVPAAPARAVIEVPVEVKRIEVPFHFTDVPLP